MTTPRTRVLIVDDEPLARERIRTLLQEEADFEIVGLVSGARTWMTGIAFVSEQRDLAIFGATVAGACVGLVGLLVGPLLRAQVFVHAVPSGEPGRPGVIQAVGDERRARSDRRRPPAGDGASQRRSGADLCRLRVQHGLHADAGTLPAFAHVRDRVAGRLAPDLRR